MCRLAEPGLCASGGGTSCLWVWLCLASRCGASQLQHRASQLCSVAASLPAGCTQSCLPVLMLRSTLTRSTPRRAACRGRCAERAAHAARAVHALGMLRPGVPALCAPLLPPRAQASSPQCPASPCAGLCTSADSSVWLVTSAPTCLAHRSAPAVHQRHCARQGQLRQELRAHPHAAAGRRAAALQRQ